VASIPALVQLINPVAAWFSQRLGRRLPFIIWTAAIRHIGALTSAIVLLAELVFGVFIACVFLGETLSASVIGGCALISAAILIVAVRPFRAERPAPPRS
jgi:drug/metabolite transporter (DMT)-like permease